MVRLQGYDCTNALRGVAKNVSVGLPTHSLRRRGNDLTMLYKIIFDLMQVDRKMLPFRGSVTRGGSTIRQKFDRKSAVTTFPINS